MYIAIQFINMQAKAERAYGNASGQTSYIGLDGVKYGSFNLTVVFDQSKFCGEDSIQPFPQHGQILAGKYKIDELLGSATTSDAYKCVDISREETDQDAHVCLKIFKRGKFDQSLDEVRILQYINSNCVDPDEKNVLRLVDFFYAEDRMCIVTELLRVNIYELGDAIYNAGDIPYFVYPRMKRIAKQILQALEYIHSLGLIHCDVKPENIVIKSYSKCIVKLIDFGGSLFNTSRYSSYIQSRSYRAPEVIVGCPYDGRIDIWSLGTVIAEMHTNSVLFSNTSVPTMLARIIDVLGPFPENVIDRGTNTRDLFTPGPDRRVCSFASHHNALDEYGDEYGEIIPQHKTSLEACLGTDVSNGEDTQFTEFVRYLLNLDQGKRPTATEALQHSWLQDADSFDIKKLNDAEGRWLNIESKTSDMKETRISETHLATTSEEVQQNDESNVNEDDDDGISSISSDPDNQRGHFDEYAGVQGCWEEYEYEGEPDFHEYEGEQGFQEYKRDQELPEYREEETHNTYLVY